MKSAIFKVFVKIVTIVTFLNLNGFNANCQNSTFFRNRKNSIHIDCATALYIGMASVNYERTIIYTKHYRLNLNSGFGGWYFVPMPKEYIGFSVPLSLNNLIGSNNNYFEADLGLRYTFLSERSDKDRFQYFSILNLGYRFQRPDGKGLLFRSFIGYSGLGIGVGKLF
jgi:hypothetical protein